MRVAIPPSIFTYERETTMKTKFKSSKFHCNLCDRSFRRASQFDRFCKSCKQHDELYRFAGWLPGKLGWV